MKKKYKSNKLFCFVLSKSMKLAICFTFKVSEILTHSLRSESRGLAATKAGSY